MSYLPAYLSVLPAPVLLVNRVSSFGHWEGLGIISCPPTSKVRVRGQNTELCCTDKALSYPVLENSAQWD